MNLKQYLGDSVYADVEDGMIKLTVENGGDPSHTVYMEPEVFDALKRWEQWVRECLKERDNRNA